MRLLLTRDVTAEELGVASPAWEDGEGYPPDHVIGPAGTYVTLSDDWDLDEELGPEVCDFENDAYVTAFVPAASVRLVRG